MEWCLELIVSGIEEGDGGLRKCQPDAGPGPECPMPGAQCPSMAPEAPVIPVRREAMQKVPGRPGEGQAARRNADARWWPVQEGRN